MSTPTTRSHRNWQMGDVFTATDAAELYEVARWGKGYFSVSAEGHLLVHPTKDPAKAIDLKQLTDHLLLRGIQLPVLIRFRDILRHRVGDIHNAFRSAISQHQYQGRYLCVYPIKVNQQRQVVEEVLDFGREYGFGLEAGSKPELLAVAAQAYNDTPIICNGFKDAEFIEMAMLAQKIGRTVIPVVEKYTELGLILKYAEKVGVRPQIGMRVKLAARGGGRWQGSGGYRSKFGLTVAEVLRGLEELRLLGMQDCFKLLHFHLGSQIPNIRIVKGALTESARIYTELVKAGAGLEYLDVGGGLGVDYDGSQTNFESSMNYTLQEYANDVVYHIQTVCDEAGIPHPTIISESGRAVVAYHSVLIFNALGVSSFGEEKIPDTIEPEDAEQPLIDLLETYQNLTPRNALESYHDAQQALDMALNLFNGGYLPLEQRCQAETLFWSILPSESHVMSPIT
ncbi:MAG TPA: biosynthetic arginine decarboxylase, partial [Vicinamibacterales bacterium]|nr:biosynthetic arginine decarboxylase [Vicinamibacterales bacterium]